MHFVLYVIRDKQKKKLSHFVRASLHSRFARVVEHEFSGSLRCTRSPKSFNVDKQLKRLRQIRGVLRNFEFFHDNKIIQFIATTIRAGKHGFLGEILLTKDFPHTSHGKNPLHSICRHCCCWMSYVTDCTSCLLYYLMEKFKTSR